MAPTRAVAAVVLGTIFALVQFEVTLTNPLDVNANVYTSGVQASQSGAAQSQIRDSDGTVRGECAYVGPQGNTIKIKYRKPQNGKVEAEANVPGIDPVAALETCEQSAKAAALAAQQSFQHVQQMIEQQQRQLQAMQENFFPNVFPFHNQFGFAGF